MFKLDHSHLVTSALKNSDFLISLFGVVCRWRPGWSSFQLCWHCTYKLGAVAATLSCICPHMHAHTHTQTDLPPPCICGDSSSNTLITKATPRRTAATTTKTLTTIVLSSPRKYYCTWVNMYVHMKLGVDCIRGATARIHKDL